MRNETIGPKYALARQSSGIRNVDDRQSLTRTDVCQTTDDGKSQRAPHRRVERQEARLFEICDVEDREPVRVVRRNVCERPDQRESLVLARKPSFTDSQRVGRVRRVKKQK